MFQCVTISKKKYSYYKPSLPKEVEKEIKKLIKQHPELGYRLVSEFILEAIRDKVKQLEKE